jgi:acyl-CoA thioesterase FadM
VALRFEDVTQDGRLVLEALPNALGTTVWRGMLTHDPFARHCFENGIVPILTRFRLQGTPGPFSAHAQLEAQATSRIAIAVRPDHAEAYGLGPRPDQAYGLGPRPDQAYGLGHRPDQAFGSGPLPAQAFGLGPLPQTRGNDAQSDARIVLDVWAELHAFIGRTYGATPRDGERALAGRVFAEHTFTRLLAPPGQRRVSPLDVPGASAIGETRAPSPAPESIASMPAGAVPLESALRLDPVPIAFGLVHTDSNMHVNSLAYLRVFEEAALRRFAELGRGSSLLARQIDIAYRKPCSAGQTMRVALQAFEHEGTLGVRAVLVERIDGPGELTLTGGRPHTFVQMTFER